MAVPVDIMIRDDAVAPAPLAGVTVGIFDPNTTALVSQAVTDEDGKATFLLPGDPEPGHLYEARFYKSGVIFPRAAGIQVQEPVTTSNVFDVVGTPAGAFGVPADQRLCRCIGRFVNYSNRPMINSLVRIAAEMELLKKTPKVVDGNMVSASAMEIHTDKNGFVVVDLLRTGEYFITFAGEEDETWNFKVPDRATANLVELIHPQPVALSYPDGVQRTVAVGETLTIPFSILFSDYQEHAKDLAMVVRFMNSDETLADLSFRPGLSELVILGKQAGVVQVTCEIKSDLFPRRVPDYAIDAPVLQVTIAP